MKKFICLFFTIFLLREVTSEAKKCYTCSSAGTAGTAGTDCDYPLNKDKIKGNACPSSATVCATYSFKLENKLITNRDCQPPKIGDKETCEALKKRNPKVSEWNCKTCDSDLCNAGHGVFDVKTVYKFVILLLFLVKLL